MKPFAAKSGKFAGLMTLYAAALLLTACAGKPVQAPATAVAATHPTLSSVLWTQTAVEYRMITRQAFQLAASQLPAALTDDNWTAIPQQTEQDGYRSLPPAVIMDVDETLLDNTPFQARMIAQGSDFDPQQWREWVAEAQASAIPGARGFIQYLKNSGIKPFYVTNRELEAPTLANIRTHLDPVATAEQVLVKNERPEWTSDKTTRRLAVAENHRVLLLLGDDYNDFIKLDYASHQQRNELAEQYREYWGQKWFMLPNPQYGHWERALPDADKSVYLMDRTERQ